MSGFWRRFKRDTKEFWNRNLRPIVEPLIKALILRKAKKETDRWAD